MKKKTILFTILALLLLGGGGAFYYVSTLDSYDLSEDVELAEIAEEEYDIVLPTEDDVVDSSIEQNSDEQDVDAEQQHEQDNGEQTEGETGGGAEPNTGTGQAKPAATVTVQMIKEKYRPSFENLEGQANDKIQAVINRAIAEYGAKRASGENLSFTAFFAKYNTAAESLEAKTDQAFERLYAALQNDLQKHGLDPSEAEDVRAQYEATKKERRSALLAKAMEKL